MNNIAVNGHYKKTFMLIFVHPNLLNTILLKHSLNGKDYRNRK